MSKLTPLNNILLELQNSQKTIAYGKGRVIKACEFSNDCARLINALNKKQHEYILSCKNSYSFAVGLFSLLQAEKKICLPPGMEKGQIDKISSGRLVVSDFYPDATHPIQEKSESIVNFKACSDGQIALFTSGSTGESKEIRKSLSQFNQEIKSLSQNWFLSEKEVAVSSVSHQHIYGLLFKIFWPLATMRPFYIDECMFENELNEVFSAHPNSILISCPAHLDAMSLFPSNNFLKDRVTFSSGAPLSLETATAINDLSGKCPIEVFGSTETGGIAWREQTKNPTWKTLLDVKISTNKDQTLLINSPFCEIQNEWYETGDKAEIISDSSFRHLGRKDRIVKVSGKRLSLDEMEQQLNNSQLVQACKVLVLNEKGNTSRESTAAILTLSDKGNKSLDELGRRKFAMSLKAQLKQYFPAVAIPRFWRYIDEFPRNSQGKIEIQLLHLFFNGFDETEKRFPELKSVSKISDKCKLTFRPDKSCDFFDGHFPENPILPGVGQIFWAQHYSEKLFGLTTIKGINKLKFHHVIQPHELCTLELIEDNKKISFSYSVEERLCSSGSLNYG